MQTQNFSKELIYSALVACISNNYEERTIGEKYLISAFKSEYFCTSIFEILYDHSGNCTKAAQKLAAIQLKNLVSKHWSEKKIFKLQSNQIASELCSPKDANNQTCYQSNHLFSETMSGKNMEEEVFIMTQTDKAFIKKSILNVIIIDKEISNIEIYLQIIYKILKYEEHWEEFIEKILVYLNEQDTTIIYIGLLIFLQLSKVSAKEITFKKTFDYHKVFQTIYPHLEKILINIYDAILANKALNDSQEYYIMNKILNKLLKIYSVSMVELPDFLKHPDLIDKWFNLCLGLLNVPISNQYLWTLPQNIDQFEFLEKNAILNIKIKSTEILFRFYEKFALKIRVSKKDKNQNSEQNIIYSMVSEKYSPILFHNFLSLLTASTSKHYPDCIISYIYEFFSLILIRRDNILLPLLTSNVENVVKHFLIYNNKLSFRDQYDFIENPKEFIYNSCDKNYSFTSRFKINEFLKRIAEFYNDSKKSTKESIMPDFTALIIEFLLCSLASMNEANIDTNVISNLSSNSSNFDLKTQENFLLKESLLYLFQSINFQFVKFYPDKIECFLNDYIYPFLINSNNAIIINSALNVLKAYVGLIAITNEGLKEKITVTVINLLSSNNLIIQTSAAILIPELFRLKNYKIEIVLSNLNYILNIYFKILNELDIDVLIFCLKKLIDEFQSQIYLFAGDLARELVQSFKKYVIKEENEALTDDEERVASKILKTLSKLISLSNKFGKEKFMQLEQICIPLIDWNFEKSISCIFADNLQLLYEILNTEFEFSKLNWRFFDNLLNLLIVEKDIQAFYCPGEGYEYAETVLVIINQLIMKDSEYFLNGVDRKGRRIIDIYFDIIPKLFYFSQKNDETIFLLVIKTLITLVETFYPSNNLTSYIPKMLALIIEEIKYAKTTSCKCFLLQAICVCLINSPAITLAYLEQNQLTGNLFELWINLIPFMKYDFEWRRSMMAFLSIFLCDLSSISPILFNNFQFIFKKIIYFAEKIMESIQAKKLGKINNTYNNFDYEEAEVSGDDLSEDGKYNNYEDKKTREILKNFIDDDFENDYEDENDEDYDELKNINMDNPQKTNMEKKSEFEFLREVINYLFNTNNQIYLNLMNGSCSEEIYLMDKMLKFDTNQL